MTQDAKHTPTPWRFTRVDINVGKLGHYVENTAGRMDALWSDATGNAVAVPAHPAQHGFGSFGFSEVDADFLLRAINSHGALVAALHLAKQQLEFHQGRRQKAWDGTFLINEIDAALALAGEQGDG